MHTNTLLPMLANPRSGGEFLICKCCRVPGDRQGARRARHNDRRLLRAELAEAMEVARDADDGFIHHADMLERILVTADHADEREVEWYWERRAMEDLIDLGKTCGCEDDPDNFAVAAEVWNGRVYCSECI